MIDHLTIQLNFFKIIMYYHFYLHFAPWQGPKPLGPTVEPSIEWRERHLRWLFLGRNAMTPWNTTEISAFTCRGAELAPVLLSYLQENLPMAFMTSPRQSSSTLCPAVMVMVWSPQLHVSRHFTVRTRHFSETYRKQGQVLLGVCYIAEVFWMD